MLARLRSNWNAHTFAVFIQPLWRTLWQFLIITYFPYDRVAPLPDVYPKEMEMYVYKKD